MGRPDSTEAALLLGLLVALGTFGFRYTFRRERLFGLYYLFLTIYAFFPLVGYYYLPELSVIINAYFGVEIWFESLAFILASLLSLLVFFGLAWSRILAAVPISLAISEHRRSLTSYLAFSGICFSIAFQASYLSTHYQDINWHTVQDEEFSNGNLALTAFIFLFKLSVAVNYVLYCLIRLRTAVFPRAIALSLAVTSTLVFGVTAFRLSNRTDVVALVLGITVFELYRVRLRWQAIARVLLTAIISLAFMLTIEATRYTDASLELDALSSLFTKDYYAPAHMLFAAVAYSIVDPLLVAASNSANALFLIGYPYLQSSITDVFNPGVASRSAGYAFYALTEGYLVAGSFGFLYNAIVLTFGMALWRGLALTRSHQFNFFLLGLMGCMTVNLVRGQSSYFIKYLYTFILPGVLIYLPLAGQSISLRWARACSRDSGATSHS
jgi:hypothetical protein